MEKQETNQTEELVNSDIFDDFGDIDLEGVDIIESESSSFMTKANYEYGREMLVSARNNLLKLFALNDAISILLKAHNQNSIEKRDIQKLLKNMSSEKNLEELANCKETIIPINRALKREIKEEEDYLKSGGHYTRSQITLDHLLLLATSIPSEVGKSIYVKTVNDICKNHKSCSEHPTLDEKKEIRKLLCTIEYHCDTEKLKTNSKLDETIISDTTLKDSDDKRVNSTFLVPSFDVLDKVIELNDYIEMLEKEEVDIIDNSSVPSIYVIDDITEVRETSSANIYNEIFCKLICAPTVNVVLDKTVCKPLTFENQIHLVGISKITVKGVDSNLLKIYQELVGVYFEEFAGYSKEEADSFADAADSIIEVPICIVEKNKEGVVSILVSDINDANKLTPAALRQYKPNASNLGNLSDQTFERYLLYLNENRGNNNQTPIWYTTITPTALNTKGFISSKCITRIEEQTTKLTNQEIFAIAKNKNLLEFLSTGYPKLSTEEQVTMPNGAVIATRYARDAAIIKDAKKVISALFGFGTEVIKYGHNSHLTANRDIIMQVMAKYCTNPVRSRVELEDIYNDTDTSNSSTGKTVQEQILEEVTSSVFAKLEYSRDRIADMFGDRIYKENFYDFIMSDQYKSATDLNIQIPAVEFIDDIWFMVQIHSMNIAMQNFLECEDTVKLKDLYTLQESEMPVEDFVEQIINYFKAPKDFLKLWGLGFDVKDAVFSATSRNYEIAIKLLLEAYGLYNLIINSEAYKNYITDDTGMSVVQLFSEGEEEMRYNEYEYNRSIPTDVTSYAAVKDILSEEFYNQYKDYLNQVIINPLLNQKNTIRTVFDSGVLINAYIKYMANIESDKSIYYRLYANHSPMEEEATLPDNVQEALDEGGLTTVEELAEMLEITLDLQSEDKDRLNKLFNVARHFTVISTVPLSVLCVTLSHTDEQGLTAFTAEDYSDYMSRLGCDVLEPSSVDFTVPVEPGEHSMYGIQEQIFGGKNLYVARDFSILKSIINVSKFKAVAKTFSNAKEPEDWETIVSSTEAIVADKLKKYTSKAVTQLKTKLKAKVRNTVDPTVLFDTVDAYIKLYAPTVIDEYMIYNTINNALTDVTDELTPDLDLSLINLPSLNEKELSELNARIKCASMDNNIISVISFFLPIEVYMKSNDEIEACREVIMENSEKEVDSAADLKQIRMSKILYLKYLNTGNVEYLDNVDFNLLPFSLLTADDPSLQRLGHYAKENLIFDHALVPDNDEEAKTELMGEDFATIFEMILEDNAEFYKNCPKAIRNYISKSRRNKLLA